MFLPKASAEGMRQPSLQGCIYSGFCQKFPALALVMLAIKSLSISLSQRRSESWAKQQPNLLKFTVGFLEVFRAS